MANEKNFSVTSANFGPKGWAVCFYLFFGYYLNTSMNTGWQNSLNYYNATYGWDTTLLLSLVSVAQFIGIALCFVLGRVALRFSARKMSLVIGVIVVACCFGINFARTIPVFIVIEMVAIMSQVAWVYTLNPLFVASWFPRKKGVVMGIVTIGVPLGAGTVTKIMNWIGANWGLNYCLPFVGCVGLVALLLLLLVVRDTPEEAGYTPDNDPNLTTADVRRMAAEMEVVSAKSPWTSARILATKESYMLSLTIGILVLFGGGFMGTNVLRMVSIGLETSAAANLMLLTAGCACVASYLLGVVDGKWGPRAGAQVCFVLCILACGFSAAASYLANVPCLVIGLVFGGGVVGGAVNFLTSITIEYWGVANFKRAYGILYPICQIPGSLGTLVIVQLSARLGGYQVAYAVLAVVVVIALMVFSAVKNGDFVKRAEEKWAAGTR